MKYRETPVESPRDIKFRHLQSSHSFHESNCQESNDDGDMKETLRSEDLEEEEDQFDVNEATNDQLSCSLHRKLKQTCSESCPARATESPMSPLCVSQQQQLLAPSDKRRSSRNQVKSRSHNRNHRVHNNSTIACERHTILHARCPQNCPDRRPARPHPRSKKSRQILNEDEEEEEEYENIGPD